MGWALGDVAASATAQARKLGLHVIRRKRRDESPPSQLMQEMRSGRKGRRKLTVDDIIRGPEICDLHVCRPGHVGSLPQETVPLRCRDGDGDEAGADGGAGEPGHIHLEPGRAGDECRQHGREERRWRHVARVVVRK